MKRIFVLGIMLMTVIMAYAGLTTEMKGDTLVITVKANGDLAVSNFSDAQKNSTKVKIITANGVKISKSVGIVSSVLIIRHRLSLRL